MMKAKYLWSLKEFNNQQDRGLTPDITRLYKTKDFMEQITVNEADALQFHPQINNKVSSIGIFHQHFNQLK